MRYGLNKTKRGIIMSVSKDKKTERWMVQLRIMGNEGNMIHRKKRGFLTKRDAQDWESEIRLRHSVDMNMPFDYFLEIYLEDLAPRI